MLDALNRFTSYPGSRDIGDREPIPRRQPECREYRGREMGEDPAKVPTREEQQAYYDKAQAKVGTPRKEEYSYRPREIGEDPAEVEAQRKAGQKREMTEQERVLDLYA